MANDNKELINVTEEKPFTVLVSILFKNIYDWAIILLTNDNYFKISKTDKNEDISVSGLDSNKTSCLTTAFSKNFSSGVSVCLWSCALILWVPVVTCLVVRLVSASARRL